MPPTHADRARMLYRHGVITRPVFNDDVTRQESADRFWRAMDEFPEYKITGRNVQRVLGGFGGLGNPSSFHHPTVQSWRVHMKGLMTPLFLEYARLRGFKNAKLEKLFDRLNVRCEAFGAVTAEEWHRDIYDGEQYKLRPLPCSLVDATGANVPDEIFGGWVNLSDRPQRFVAIVGSHRGADAMEAQRKGGGFAKLTPQQIEDQNVHARLLRQANRTIGTSHTNEEGHIIIPPGHVLVFYQRLLHSVAGGKQPAEPQLRIANGVRLTGENVPLFDHDVVIANNGVPHIPSGQTPPMYSANHYSFFSTTPRYRDWGLHTFKDVCLFERTVKATGQVYYTPGSKHDQNKKANTGRYMPSLVEMGLEPYPYTPEAIKALTPTPLACHEEDHDDVDISLDIDDAPWP